MIVGIDLGTTTSLVGVLRHGSPQLVPDALLRKTLFGPLRRIDSSVQP